MSIRPSAVSIVLGATLALAGAAGGESRAEPGPAAGGARACAEERIEPWMGAATIRSASIPGPGQRRFPALVMAPADRDRYPGRRPAVTFQHGVNSDFCNLFWLHRYLAGHGYVAIAYSATPEGGETSLRRSLIAMRAAVDFAGSRRNPFVARTDGERIGVGGFSIGAETSSIVQGDRDVDAAVVLDNLRRWRRGDPGGVGQNCTGARRGQIAPAAPSLGFAQDAACKERPDFAPRSLKQYGFRHWRAKRVASMELVMRGFDHTDFGNKGNERQRRLVGHYTLAWFDRWLGGGRKAERRLLARRVQGRPRRALLSRSFDSGAFIPGRINTTRFR